MDYIQNIAEILASDTELGEGTFQLGNLQITIVSSKGNSNGRIWIYRIKFSR